MISFCVVSASCLFSPSYPKKNVIKRNLLWGIDQAPFWFYVTFLFPSVWGLNKAQFPCDMSRELDGTILADARSATPLICQSSPECASHHPPPQFVHQHFPVHSHSAQRGTTSGFSAAGPFTRLHLGKVGGLFLLDGACSYVSPAAARWFGAAKPALWGRGEQQSCLRVAWDLFGKQRMLGTFFALADEKIAVWSEDAGVF